MTKEKAMYQTWLIIEGLPAEERNYIDKELLEEIKNNMEYDEKIQIDFSVPLEKQKLDSATWKMLDKVIKSAEKNGFKENKKRENKVAPKEEVQGNELERIKLEKIALSEELQKFRDESKGLLEKYKGAYEETLEENKKLKQDCESLIKTINSVPKFLRNIFIKDENVKQLMEGKKEEK